MELRRPRGQATFVSFPIINSSGSPVTGLNSNIVWYATFTDVIAPNTKFSTLTYATLTEIGTTGWYYASLTATEMTNDYVLFLASPTAGAGLPANLLLNCTAVASVTNVGSVTYAVPINWASISGATTAQTLSGTVIGTTTDIGQTGADHIIDTDLALGGRGNTRNVQNALRFLRNRRAITAGVMQTATLTAYQENDTSTAWTAVVSTASVVGFSDVDAT